MAFDAYLKIDGIEGQSVDKAHDKWIDLLQFSQGTVQLLTGGRAVESSGRGDIEPFTFVHVVDKATPKLQQGCLKGDNITKAQLAVCKNIKGATTPVYEVQMEGIKIIKAHIFSPDDKSDVFEEVQMVPQKISWKVTPIKPDGSKDGAVETKWNVLQNTES